MHISRMKTFNLQAMQKKGQAGINGKMTALFGAVILIFLISALAPDIFTELGGLTTGGAPSWVETVMIVVVGAGLVFLVWRLFNNK